MKHFKPLRDKAARKKAKSSARRSAGIHDPQEQPKRGKRGVVNL